MIFPLKNDIIFKEKDKEELEILFTLTKKQEEGLKIAIARYKNHEPYTCIAGFAGTGKTTLVKVIIDSLRLTADQVAYVAYTGKAAQVLRSRGCINAKTAHKLLYKSVLNEKTGKFYHIPLRYLDSPYRIIVVDEVSMLPKEMWDLLLSHHIHVLALGDPAQLPAIGTSNANVLDHPHIFLDEIMRQSQDSEIIRLTMNIRENKSLELFSGQDVRVVDQKELEEPGLWKWPDQILVGKNATRYAVNNFIRTNLFNKTSAMPEAGDKIICIKNNWTVANASGDALVNGLTGTIKNIREQIPANYFTEKTFKADFTPDFEGSGVFADLEMDQCIFTEHRQSKNKIHPEWAIPREFQPEQFDYGYAITAHKSQGSEYNKVLVLEEFLRGQGSAEHARWLYTAATRASQKLVIVRNYRL